MSHVDPYSLDAFNDNHSARVIQVENGKQTNTIVICAVLCTLSAVIAAWAWKKADSAETESRLTQYYLLDPHSRTPEELAAWTKFRLEHEKE